MRDRELSEHSANALGQQQGVSVVIAALDEERFIESTIESILGQDYIGPIEVLVADGGSSDATAELASGMSRVANHNRAVHVVPNELRHAAGGFQAGFNSASYELVMICGSRTLLEPHHIRRAVELLTTGRSRGISVVGGGIRRFVAAGNGALEVAAAFLYESRAGAGVAAYLRRTRPGFVDTVYCGLYDRDVVRRVGGMDLSLARGQDADLNIRIARSGAHILFHPDLSSTYRFKISISGVVKRGLTTGAMAAGGWVRSRSVLAIRHLAPLALLLASLAALPVFWLVPVARFGISALAVGYVAILTAEGFRLAPRRPLAALAVPLVFSAYHYSYGIGELVGLISALPGLRRRSTSNPPLH